MSATTVAVRERPILFSGPMVRAILYGTKTQTRRVVKPQPYSNGYHFDGRDIRCFNDYLPPSATLLDVGRGRNRYTTSDLEGWEQSCPYGVPGDLLWVRETWADYRYLACSNNGVGIATTSRTVYRADNGSEVYADLRWRPSIHMPRWASRLTLEITDVRVQRLQEISYEDVLAEGCPRKAAGADPADFEWYRHLWDSINAKRGYSWESNPWVFALTFRRVE